MFDSLFVRRALLPLLLLLSAVICSNSPLKAQPSLTTIQDTVYLADGKRFDGLVLIDWRSFDTANGAVIGQSGKVVQILNGFLRVQLAPTTVNNSTYYSVKFLSRGVILFSEVWSVPATAATLRLRDVRAALLPGGFVSGSNVPGNNTPPPIVGNTLGTGTFVDNETPAGEVNGSNAVFTLTSAPSPGTSLQLYRNGLLLSAGLDYTLSGLTITFLSGALPATGDLIRASFRNGGIGNSAHNLLSADHPDTLAENVQRGDLVTGQASGPGGALRWTRLQLGASNRCLVSNGLDAVWNSCLFTNFTPGQVPFVTGSRSLAEAASSLFWNETNRRFGVGTALPSTTLHVQETSGAGVTGLTVQSGASQGANFLSRWLNSAGTELARVSSDGALSTPRVDSQTTTLRAAWRDAGVPLGTPSDPTQLASGDFWFSAGQRARKTYEAGQIHPLPQVVCSSTGPTSASAGAPVSANCYVPIAFFDSGDRLEVAMNVQHTGTTSQFRVEMCIQICNGSNAFFSNDFAATIPLAFARGSGGLFGRIIRNGQGVETGRVEAIAWGINFISTVGVGGQASEIDTQFTQPFAVAFRVSLLSSGTQDTLNLRNFSVIRYPAQSNPLP